MGRNANGTGDKSAKPRLYLVGEGESEIGHRPPQEMHRYQEGALAQFLARVLIGASWDHQDELPFGAVDAMKWSNVPLHHVGGRKRMTYAQLASTSTTERRVQALLVAAKMKGADCVVILLDREKTNLPDVREKVLGGHKAYLAARATAGLPATDPAPGLVVGVPCRCLETWLLADPEARKTVLGSSEPDPFSTQPEERPAPQELKLHLRNSCQAAHLKVHEARRMLAAAARPETLNRRCPRSYVPFLEGIKRELMHTTRG
jgi:hypothetical protein